MVEKQTEIQRLNNKIRDLETEVMRLERELQSSSTMHRLEIKHIKDGHSHIGSAHQLAIQRAVSFNFLYSLICMIILNRNAEVGNSCYKKLNLYLESLSSFYHHYYYMDTDK